MKRRIIFKLLVFLLLGAIINVAVAWGCASIPGRLQPTKQLSAFPPMEWSAFGIQVQSEYSAGIPLKCLSGTALSDGVTHSLKVPQWLRPAEIKGLFGGRVLPLHPLWPGFALNTIFYAAIAWMLFAMPFTIRRRRRIKRGECVRCAYPVGTSPACTECGAPVGGSFR